MPFMFTKAAVHKIAKSSGNQLITKNNPFDTSWMDIPEFKLRSVYFFYLNYQISKL